MYKLAFIVGPTVQSLHLYIFAIWGSRRPQQHRPCLGVAGGSTQKTMLNEDHPRNNRPKG